MKNIDSILFRQARETDAPVLLDIYAPFILHTPVTFEYTVPSLAEFEGRIRDIILSYPYIVAVCDGQAAGYAYASSFKNRAAYDWSAEVSIYIKETFHGMGIGKALYSRLEQILKIQNIRNLCACITYPNPSSIAFHEACGFRTVAHFTKSGYKFHTWYDMIWMEKSIREHSRNPEPFIPITSLSGFPIRPEEKRRYHESSDSLQKTNNS